MTRILMGLSLVVLASGCAQYTPAAKPDEAPTGQEAYLFGRFKAGAATYGTISNNEMGFVFQCRSGKKVKRYTLRFNYDTPVQVVKVSPSTCSLVEVVFTNSYGAVQGSKPAPADWFRNMELQPGIAYYLGDYHATIHADAQRSRWALDEVTNDYARTTREMHEQYSALAGVPTEDLTLKGLPRGG